MKVILLAGGLGSRLAEETVVKPKPMVEIGGKPILLHIMNIYARHGFNEFVVACGYKGTVIKEFFNDFYVNNADFTISFKNGDRKIVNQAAVDWTVSLVDTGLNTMTGGRVRRLRNWVGNETFMVTYGDGVGDIDIRKLVEFHRLHGKLATITAVQPPARFGNLELDGDRVSEFTEKVLKQETWINGGFMVLEPGVFDFLPDDDSVPLEKDPLTNLARAGQLMAYKHRGFWHPMDTIRDRSYLEDLWASGKAPW